MLYIIEAINYEQTNYSHNLKDLLNRTVLQSLDQYLYQKGCNNVMKHFPGFLTRKGRTNMQRKPPKELAFVLMFEFIENKILNLREALFLHSRYSL